MMQGNKLMVVIAVVAGLMATVLAFTYINSATSAIEEPEKQVAVLFVVNDLRANHIIDPAVDLRPEMVGIVTSAGLARSAVKAEERESLMGVMISSPLPAGVPLLYSHLTEIQDLDLKPGMRAMSINVRSDNLMGGILVPGDHVDIIVSYPVAPEPADLPEFDMENPEAALGALMGQVTALSGAPGEWEAEEVLSNVPVLAIAGQLTFSRQAHMFGAGGPGGGAGSSTVTLELTPDQAKNLIRTTAGGSNPITLLLRPKERKGESGGALFVEE
jgi:Flp pilus assembly protein CpaB